MLRSANPETRRSTASALIAVEAWRGGLSLLVEWAESERALAVLLGPLYVFPFLLPLKRRVAVAVRALAHEAPSERMAAVRLLEQLPTKERRRVARMALKTEPEPVLVKQLRKAMR